MTGTTKNDLRIGIDLGGTKIEALAIDSSGVELARYRVDTPRNDYKGTIDAMVGLVRRLEAETGRTGTVGAGIPGTISGITGLVKPLCPSTRSACSILPGVYLANGCGNRSTRPFPRSAT